MVWLKVKANIALETKFLNAGPVASWLWIAGLGFCRIHETDGFIAKVHVSALSPGLSSPFKHAATLVRVTLWEDVIGGYQVHDYLDWNPSREEIKSFRDTDNVRKRTKRPAGKDDPSSRNPDGEITDSNRTPFTGAGADAKSPSPYASGSGLGSSEESVRETTVESSDGVPPAWGHGRKGALARAGGLVVPTHPNCDPATFAACNRGKCVPVKLANEWRTQFQGDHEAADRDIRATLADWIAKNPRGAIGDNAFNFWGAVWRDAHGSQAPVQTVTGTTKVGRSLLAAKAAYERAGGAQ